MISLSDSSTALALETDENLVAMFVGGTEAAFVEIMRRYRAKMFSVTLSLLRNHADAEEITQDTFIRAHRGLAQFRGESSLATWLRQIATNLARNRYWYYFRRRRQDTLSLDFALDPESENSATFSDLVAAEGADPRQPIVVDEFSGLVLKAFEKISPTHRQILTEKFILGKSYSEISESMGIPLGTVRSCLFRARESLMKKIALMEPLFKDTEALRLNLKRTRL